MDDTDDTGDMEDTGGTGGPKGTDESRDVDGAAPPLVIVDAANVVGSVPDGWWRDRRGAAERLRDRLAAEGVPGRTGPVEVVLVVEGAARGVESVPGVRVESAPGSGDDHMVELVAGAARDRPVLVVTADRELRRRVTELGAEVAGPRAVRPR
ncbi:NTP pyrophosphohydrolase [Streptomyces parvulus]